MPANRQRKGKFSKKICFLVRFSSLIVICSILEFLMTVVDLLQNRVVDAQAYIVNVVHNHLTIRCNFRLSDIKIKCKVQSLSTSYHFNLSQKKNYRFKNFFLETGASPASASGVMHTAILLMKQQKVRTKFHSL